MRVPGGSARWLLVCVALVAGEAQLEGARGLSWGAAVCGKGWAGLEMAGCGWRLVVAVDLTVDKWQWVCARCGGS